MTYSYRSETRTKNLLRISDAAQTVVVCLEDLAGILWERNESYYTIRLSAIDITMRFANSEECGKAFEELWQTLGKNNV